MPQKKRIQRYKKHTEQKIERLYSQSVHLARPLPDWPELVEEARAFYRFSCITERQVLNYARHTYTNYDLLMDRMRRRVKRHNVATEMARRQWQHQAIQLVRRSLGLEASR